MLVVLVAAVAVFTAAMLIQAGEARLVGKPLIAVRWLAASVPLGLVTVAAARMLLRQPRSLRWVPPTGLGPQWECTENAPPSARICFRH